MILTVLRRLSAVTPARGLLCLMTATIWLALAEAAAAQAPNAAPPASKDYYLQYMLVALCVALGLLAALRPSTRQDPEGGAVGWFGMAMGGGHGAETPTRPGERRKEPHRGTAVLVMSICGLLFCIPSLVSVSMARQDLAAMKAGKMDRSGEGLTNAAFWISVASLVLWLIAILVIAAVVAVRMAAG